MSRKTKTANASQASKGFAGRSVRWNRATAGQAREADAAATDDATGDAGTADAHVRVPEEQQARLVWRAFLLRAHHPLRRGLRRTPHLRRKQQQCVRELRLSLLVATRGVASARSHQPPPQAPTPSAPAAPAPLEGPAQAEWVSKAEVRDLKRYHRQLDAISNLRVCSACGEEHGAHEVPDEVYAEDAKLLEPMGGQLVKLPNEPLRICIFCKPVLAKGRRPVWAHSSARRARRADAHRTPPPPSRRHLHRHV